MSANAPGASGQGLRDVDWGPLFKPSVVAVVGASDREGSPQRRLYSLLRDRLTARGARVHPVHPTKPEILGATAYPTVQAIPEQVDVAVLLIHDPVGAVEDCVAAGARFAIIHAADFADVDSEEGREVLDRLRELGRGATRLVGPNTTLNIYEPWRQDIPGKKLAVITHSGHMGRPIVQGENLGIAIEAWATLGNEIDVEWADMVAHLASQPNVGAIASYVEGFPDGRKMMQAADVAMRAGVPLVCIKVGRSEAGQSVAKSHTGHLTGSDAVHDAVFDQYGVVRVDDIDELVEISGLFCHASLDANSAGGRIGLYGLSGAVAAHATDMCTAGGLKVERFSQETIDELAKILPRFLSRSNPVDSGGIVTTTSANRRILELIRNDPNVDMLFVPIVGPFTPITDALVRDIIALHKVEGKPVITAWTSSVRDQFYRDLCDAGVPLFHSLTGAVRGMYELTRWTKLRSEYRSPWSQRKSTAHSTPREVSELLQAESLNEMEAKQVLRAYGIPTVQEWVVSSADNAVKAAHSAGSKAVVLKVLSRHVSHKSEFGFVEVGVRGDAAVRDAFQRLMDKAAAHLKSNPEGIIVQPMIGDAVAEVILGLSHQPPFGPTITFGLGGVMTEIFSDVAYAVPPVNREYVERMIAKTRSSALLRGFRGRPAGDIPALVDAILTLQRLAIDVGGRISELDINPIMVRPAGSGVVAVDALIVPQQNSVERKAHHG